MATTNRKKAIAPEPLRPMPPEILFDPDNWTKHFMPAHDLPQWVQSNLLDEDAKMYNEDHSHLKGADIRFMWAAWTNKRQMRTVIGQCEEVAFRCGAWQKGRQEQQMTEWYGRVPDYLITLDADYCHDCSDLDFCALVEHELYHIGQKRDAFGQPTFTQLGMPALTMRGHDVEEFIGVVRRYGPTAEVKRLLEVANNAPEVAHHNIAAACGTCLLRVA